MCDRLCRCVSIRTLLSFVSLSVPTHSTEHTTVTASIMQPIPSDEQHASVVPVDDVESMMLGCVESLSSVAATTASASAATAETADSLSASSNDTVATKKRKRECACTHTCFAPFEMEEGRDGKRCFEVHTSTEYASSHEHAPKGRANTLHPHCVEGADSYCFYARQHALGRVSRGRPRISIPASELKPLTAASKRALLSKAKAQLKRQAEQRLFEQQQRHAQNRRVTQASHTATEPPEAIDSIQDTVSNEVDSEHTASDDPKEPSQPAPPILTPAKPRCERCINCACQL